MIMGPGFRRDDKWRGRFSAHPGNEFGEPVVGALDVLLDAGIKVTLLTQA
ncbi:hypothetical protein ABIF38_000703 [Bradyrhizobium japonicum]|uniref:Uncharacterized protein n=1 Tax=Bradyrhizobium elkanii TaxID=29448 RepID=A0ABV4ES83_BRAEL|nr:hypothetical protein [Bradyrhizobium elkanii]MBP2429549.1 hypothetical protein [Bradyrhizobium elkanii]MCP1736979.1 hypothetical protein [Bradyrhizobium elkanii]MCP1755024.1 hypothetical protein [Bradyrhizobium elkanii]MCP1980542.1 hypothetical protein [Bradyrhizobium elkanii]MCS3572319.1 hypothetical protein [Bradyrhizobium elkanii]